MPHTGRLPTTKSERVAVGDCEERVSARKLAKQPFRPRAVRSTPTSRDSPAAGFVSLLLFVYAHGTVMGALFTIANVLPGGGVICTRLPLLSSPVHRKTLIAEA